MRSVEVSACLASSSYVGNRTDYEFRWPMGGVYRRVIVFRSAAVCRRYQLYA